MFNQWFRGMEIDQLFPGHHTRLLAFRSGPNGGRLRGQGGRCIETFRILCGRVLRTAHSDSLAGI
jgi:hypothetical protein